MYAYNLALPHLPLPWTLLLLLQTPNLGTYPHYWHLVVITGDLFKLSLRTLPPTSTVSNVGRASYWNTVLFKKIETGKLECPTSRFPSVGTLLRR